MHNIDISELTPQMQQLLSNIQSGEELLITSENQPIAKIVLVNGQDSESNGAKRKRRRAGTAKGNFWMSPDFNEPLEDFAEYMP